MKQTLWIAAAGALLLAGCKSSDVMDQRNYSGPNPEEITQLPPPKTTTTSPAVQTPVSAYEPMTGIVSTGGVDSVAPVSTKTSTYVVQKGDTLGKIAANHGVKLGALMAINNLDAQKAKQLRVGQKLTIPAGGAAVKSTGKTSVAATGKLDKDGLYSVKSGDSIAKIAHRFKIKTSDLLQANNMTEEDSRHLQIGQKLVIPGKSPATAVAVAPAAPASVAPAPVVETTVVMPEAATTTVVVKESVPAPAATAESAPVVDLSKTTIIEVTEESISLADFAKKHGTDANTLRQLNQGCAQTLQKGDPIIIPTKE